MLSITDAGSTSRHKKEHPALAVYQCPHSPGREMSSRLSWKLQTHWGKKSLFWIVSCDGRGFRWTLCPRRGRHCQRMKPSSTNTHRGEKSWVIEKERKKQDHSFWTPGFIWSRGNYSPGSPKCMSHLLLFLNQLELGFCHYKNTYDQYRTSAKLLRTTALNRMQQQPTVRMRMVVETGCKRHESLRRRIHLQCRLSSKHTAFPLSLTHRSLVLPM